MGIPSSGEIKMGGTGTNSIAQVKAGTDTGTPSAVQNVSLQGLSADGANDFQYIGGAGVDFPVAGSSPDQTAPHAMSEFHGYVQAALDGWPSSNGGLTKVPAQNWGQESHFGTGFISVSCGYGQNHDTANDRIAHRWHTSNSTAATIYQYAYQDYTGLDSATIQAKATYTISTSTGSTNLMTFQDPASYSPATNTWTNVSTNSGVYSPRWDFSITNPSGGNYGTGSIYSTGTTGPGGGNFHFYNRATLGGTTYPSAADGYDGNQYYRSQGNTLSLILTRGTTASPGGPGGGPGGGGFAP